MAESRQKTVNRPDDGRLRTGARLLFDRETELEALMAARILRRLTPKYQRAVRLLCECFLYEQARQDVEIRERGALEGDPR